MGWFSNLAKADVNTTSKKAREAEIWRIFDEMATAIRGSRQFKPNPRTEAFITRKKEQLLDALGSKKK